MSQQMGAVYIERIHMYTALVCIKQRRITELSSAVSFFLNLTNLNLTNLITADIKKTKFTLYKNTPNSHFC